MQKSLDDSCNDLFETAVCLIMTSTCDINEAMSFVTEDAVTMY